MEYNKNLEILKELRPEVYKKIVEADIDKLERKVEKIETILARDGNPIATVTKDGKQYRMNSAFRPVEEAQKWAQQYSFDNLNNNVTMYGFGNGYFVRALLERLPENDFLIIYEPSAEMFLHVLQNYDLESILSDQRVIIGVEGINKSHFHLAIRNTFQVSNIVNNTISMHPVYDKLFPEQFEHFKSEIKNSAETARIEYNTLQKQAQSTFRNNFINIPKIRNSVSIMQLEKIWNPDIPVILVAAGPSVEQSIDELKKAKGKVIIIAVDRILQYLLDRDVVPDFAVTLDPQKSVKNFTTRESVDVPLFCIMQSKPQIMDKQVGKKIITWTGNYMSSHYQEVEGDFPNVPTSGSVATFALSVLNSLGTKTVYLVGQDLAYHGESTHAGGVVSNPYATDSEWVDGVNGEKVLARYDWVEYCLWFEDFIITHPDITIIDTKKQGALIKGSKMMSLDEGLAGCDYDVAGLVTELNQMSPTFSEEYFEKIKEGVIQDKDTLTKMKQKAKEGVGLCMDMITLVKQEKMQNKNFDSKLQKVQKIIDFLNGQSFYPNLDDLVVRYMDKAYIKVFTTKDDEKENMLNVCESSRSYFEGVIEALKYAEPILEECIKEL